MQPLPLSPLVDLASALHSLHCTAHCGADPSALQARLRIEASGALWSKSVTRLFNSEIVKLFNRQITPDLSLGSFFLFRMILRLLLVAAVASAELPKAYN